MQTQIQNSSNAAKLLNVASFDSLKISVDKVGIAQITMARPQVFNAFDEQMIAELDRAIELLNNEPSVRVLILAGEGKHFSAGADLKWMQRASEADAASNLADARRFAAMLHRLHTSPKPTVARVNGAALGGGVGLICACDIAVASTSSSYAVSEAKFGILPAVIGPYLVGAIGKRQARYLALSTRRIDAQTALSMGMVQRVVAEDALDVEVASIVKDLVIGGKNAQAEIKKFMEHLSPVNITPDEREFTAQTIARVRGTAEAREGFAAFLAKRPPNWVPQ